MIPIVAQSLLSALTCVLIAAIGNTCWDKRTGIAAGLMSAFYPGFIINSGRLYSESFACFLICLVIWLVAVYLICDKRDYKWGFLLGASLFALQVTRSIMIGLSIAILALLVASCFLLVGHRRAIGKYLAAALIAFILCLLPWLFLQKMAYGKTSFIVDRRSNYNLYIGNDIDGLGWLRIPYPDCRGIDQSNSWNILSQSINKSPDRWLKLMLDKPIRLLKSPWNDFKSSIGIVTPDWQVTFHQLILAFAVLGLAISSLLITEKFRRPRIVARCIIVLAIILHFIYLLFDTVPRYALTAMPEFILFAGAGVAVILNLIESRRYAIAAISFLAVTLILVFVSNVDILRLTLPFNGVSVTRLTMPLVEGPFALVKFNLLVSILLKLIVGGSFFIACGQLVISWSRLNKNSSSPIASLFVVVLLGIFVLPAYSLPLRAHGRWYEWSYILNSGERANRCMRVNEILANRLVRKGAYLAVNIEGASDLSTVGDISVNDAKIKGPFIPALAIAQDLSLIKLGQTGQLIAEQEFILKCLCDMSSKSPLDLRQWYLIPVDGAQWKKIIKNRANVGDQGQADGTLLDINVRKANDNSTIYGAYIFDPRFVMMPSIFRYSWEKVFYGSDNPSVFGDSSYDDRVEHSALANDRYGPGTGIYIKLLIPHEDMLTGSSKVSGANGNNLSVTAPLKMIDKQYKEIGFSGESSLSFKPNEKIIANKKQDGYWFIRLVGQLDHDNIKELGQSASVQFTHRIDKINGQQDLSYVPVWQPACIKLHNGAGDRSNLVFQNDGNLKFDYCFPIMLSAFPGRMKAIQIHLVANKIENRIAEKQDHKNNLKCCLEIYQVTKPPSGASCEIF